MIFAALATTFSTPIVLRAAERLAARLDRRLPHRVRRLLKLYPSWLESLASKAREAREGARWRRLVVALVIDVAALIGLTILTATFHVDFARSVGERIGIGAAWADRAVVGRAVLLAFPLIFGLLRTGRRLGRELAELALPVSQGLDLAAAPRRAMVALLELVVVGVASLLFVAASQPVLSTEWGIVVVIVMALGLSWVFWRTSGSLDGHVRAGAQAVAEALLSPVGEEHLEEVERLLPGMGDLTRLVVPAGAFSAGLTLAELDLRGRTGATVLAVRRDEATHELPGADWRVAVGDNLDLTGSREAIRAAREILLSVPGNQG